MGFFDLFLPTIECDQCGARLPRKYAISRRGSELCDDGCVAAWVAAHPPPRASGGTTEQYLQQATESLTYAHGELCVAVRASGGHVDAAHLPRARSEDDRVISALRAVADQAGTDIVRDGQREERVRVITQAVMDFERYSAEAQRFLHALDMTDEAVALEELDLFEIMGGGAYNFRSTLRLLEAALARVASILEALPEAPPAPPGFRPRL